MGAWIETNCTSNPPPDIVVAPYMGAWIETMFRKRFYKDTPVAPYMGAWIETRIGCKTRWERRKSHPTWVRGLKPKLPFNNLFICCRTLHGCVD